MASARLRGPSGRSAVAGRMAPVITTGSASGALGCYLVTHRLVSATAAGAITSAQGVKMGRPSRVLMRVEATSPADITRVHVGGCAVEVGGGELRWQD